MPRSSADTRTKILDAAQALIQRGGLNAMSFKDLSTAVGIRKPSVHHHFATKADMVNALLERYIEDFGEAVSTVVRSRASGKTKLKRYFDLFLQTSHQDKSCLCGMLVAEKDSLDNEGKALVRRFLQANSATIQTLLNEGAADGSLSDCTGMGGVVLATLEGGLLISRCDGGPKQFSRLLEKLMTLLTS